MNTSFKDLSDQRPEDLEDENEDELLLRALDESMRTYAEENKTRSKVDNHLINNRISSSKGSISLRNTENSTSICGIFCGLNENGFDLGAGSTWIYPTNYPIRDYQYNIVHSALFKNTLVSLPTGLGKTFIAAVVMFNFYRWYPEGKILFLAPTRPLVTQQIDSCYRVMGIPQDDTAEMTGQIDPAQREVKWKKHRMFFLTPQSLMSDLVRSTCPVEKIRCIVLDEAHRATGNYAYCQVIRAICPFNKHFRVLALSATPGNDMQAVQQVIDNLLIDHIEVRDESSPDTMQYSNKRVVETIVVKLSGFHEEVQKNYLQILGSYMDVLLKWKVVVCSLNNVSKYALIIARDKFRNNQYPGMSRDIANQIESSFAICITLAHGLELISQHGLRNFVRYVKKIIDEESANNFSKNRLKTNTRLSDLLNSVKEKLGETDLVEPDLNTSIGTIQTQSAPSVYSHPKMEKLREVVMNHFQLYRTKEGETRVMIFCQYRDTVVEICHLLSRLKPLVKAMSFVGQSSGRHNKGFSQKEQLLIMQKFRKGGFNTLVSTSIGEEGLDIGEVDLIICYDSQASAVRLVQRMGRTGRKREGRIVMLLTDGKEKMKYQKSLSHKKFMNNGMTNCKALRLLYRSPRMIPPEIEPQCYKMFMTMPKKMANKDIKKMFLNKKAVVSKSDTGKSTKILDEFVNDFEEDVFLEKLPEAEYLHGLDTDEILKFSSMNEYKLDLSSDLDWMLNDTERANISCSRISFDFLELLEFAGRRRCDIPLTQAACLSSQVCRKDLWPNKKRKKTSSVQLHGPAKKKKSKHTTVINVKQDGQAHLSDLWSSVSEQKINCTKSDAECMPPPPLPPPQKISVKDKKAVNDTEENNFVVQDRDCYMEEIPDIMEETVSHESFVDFKINDAINEKLKQQLKITSEMLSRIESLEEESFACCRFAKTFHSSDLSSLLIGTTSTKKTENISELDRLAKHANMEYFRGICNPSVWKDFKASNENNLYYPKDTLLDPLPESFREDDRNSFDVESTLLDQKSSINCLSIGESGINYDRGNDVNENQTNFNLGISQLLFVSPDIPGDTDSLANSSSETNFDSEPYQTINDVSLTKNNPDNEQNHSGEKFLGLVTPSKGFESMKLSTHLCDDVPLKKRRVTFLDDGDSDSEFTSFDVKKHCESDIFGKGHREGNQVEALAGDADDISKFVEDSMTKWWKSEDEFAWPELDAEVCENEGCQGPPSPILSSQRSKTVNSCSSSTPKAPKSNLIFTNKKHTMKQNWTTLELPVKELENSDDSLSNKVLSSNKRKKMLKRTGIFESDTSSLNMEADLNSSLEDFEISKPVKPLVSSANKLKKNVSKNKKKKSDEAAVFIENEAEESREDRCSSTDGENTSGLDDLDESFVDEDDVHGNNSVDIHAYYLQSVKSPIKKQGGFKIKENKKFTGNIYSQMPTEDELNESYEEDSFCVNSGDDSPSLENNEVHDTLDIIEAVLATEEKNVSSVDEPKKKRKRIRVMSSSSEDADDTIQNRGEMNNSHKNCENQKSSPLNSSANDELKNIDIILESFWDDDFIDLENKTLSQNNIQKFEEIRAVDNTLNNVNKNYVVSNSNTSSNAVKKQLQFPVKSNRKERLTDFFSFKQKNVHVNEKNKVESVVRDSLEMKGECSSDQNSDTKIRIDMQKKEISGNERLTIIASTKQVIAAPEIITALKSRHKMNVLVHSVRFAHFIVSSHVGVVRISFEDFCRPSNFQSLLDLANNLKSEFKQAFIVVQLVPERETKENNLWSGNCVDFMTRLRSTDIRVLYSEDKASSADILANLSCREYSCNRTIKVTEFSPNQMAVIRFLESLPCINMALAIELCCKYKKIVNFIKSSKSVPEIRQLLGITRGDARKFYYLMNDVL